jgi:hypothetical protein
MLVCPIKTCLITLLADEDNETTRTEFTQTLLTLSTRGLIDKAGTPTAREEGASIHRAVKKVSLYIIED